MAYYPCTGCRRHVRDNDTFCPFCNNARTTVQSRPAAPSRLSRASAFLFVSTIAATGCSSSDATVNPPAPTDTGASSDGTAIDTGAADTAADTSAGDTSATDTLITDSGADAARDSVSDTSSSDAGPDASGDAKPDISPPDDAAPSDGGPVKDGGGPMPLYGAPPPPPA